jgi:hypothetical protein
MNSKHHRLTGILILLLGLAACHTTMAARQVKVSSADPSEAPQGTTTLVVTINGSGFDTTPGAVEALNFLLPCNTDICTNTGGVTVRPGWVVKSTKKITATIDIAEDAVVEFRDIEVKMTRGRGGKGTTLFKVQASTKPKGGFSLPDITVEYTGLAWEEAFQPGGPDFPPGWENWTDNTLSSIPRPCFINVHLVDPPTGGRYDCDYEDAIGGRISIDLTGIQGLNSDIWVAVNSGNKAPPNPEFCELLNRWEEFPKDVLSVDRLPLEFGTYWYTINFMEGCTDSDCHIGISHQSFNGEVSRRGGGIQLHPFYDLSLSRLPEGMATLPDVGRLIVKTWATGVPAPDDYNAFTQPQSLAIEGYEIRFGNTKNGAILAACRTLEGTVGGVVLETCPDPFGCEY